MRNKKYAVVSAVVAVIMCGSMLSGCSSSASKGGDATCAEYMKMSDKDQTKAITLLLKEKDQNPSNGMISLSKMSAKMFCKTAGNDNSRIREING